MNTKEAISLFRHYQQSNHRKRTAESYRSLLQHFESLYADRHLDSIKPDEIYHFLEQMTGDLCQIHQKVTLCPTESLFQLHHRKM